MKAISYSEFFLVFKDLHGHLLTRGLNPEYMRLNSEASTAFQIQLKSKDIKFQLASPGIHRRNADERVISIFKYYFIAGI